MSKKENNNLIPGEGVLDNYLQEIMMAAKKSGYLLGYRNGYDDGNQDGYNAGRKSTTPAVSDGLRHGSSECGSLLNSLKTK